MVQPSEQGGKGKAATTAGKSKGIRTKQGGRGIMATLAQNPGQTEGVRLQLIEKAWGYKVRGYSPREIADAICDEFGIEGPIHHKTIYGWLDEGRAMVSRKIAMHREEHIATVIPRCEEGLRYWLPRAVGRHKFAIARMEQVNGKMIEVIDDAVFKEEAKAAEISIKLMEQQRKVLGVGLATAGDEQDGKAASLTQINNLLISITQNNAPAPGKQVGQGPVLLEAGDQNIDGI